VFGRGKGKKILSKNLQDNNILYLCPNLKPKHMKTLPKKQRTAKQTAEVVAKTVGTINNVIEVAQIMNGYTFFNSKLFKESGLDLFIKKICLENDINEDHIRTVSGIKLTNKS
jgi:hypothetical protein